MTPDELANILVEIIKSEPEKIVEFIQNEDWEDLRDELSYIVECFD